MINGIIFNIFLPYTEQITTVKKVISPQNNEAYKLYVDEVNCFVKSPIALPANDKPIIATVGPIITGGINLLIH